MARYKLSHAADNDLDRLYVYGAQNFGEAMADSYYVSLITRLVEISEQPLL